MKLKASYDNEANSLLVRSYKRGVTSTTLEHDWDVILDLATENQHSKVVAVEVLHASAYLPLGRKGYDPETDTLMLGTREGATEIDVLGDLVAYWKPDPVDPSEIYIALGLEVRSARRWLGGLAGPVRPAEANTAGA